MLSFSRRKGSLSRLCDKANRTSERVPNQEGNMAPRSTTGEGIPATPLRNSR